MPHINSINSSGTSAINLSTITTESSQHIVVSPRPLTYTPRKQHNHNRLKTHTTEEQKSVGKKRKQQNESGDHEDSSKITAIMIGTESQTEQPVYNHENGIESKQYHDVHMGLNRQQHH